MSANNRTESEHRRRPGVEAFPHDDVGIDSLAELATRHDRVCVLNILGDESGSVPMSELGDIPVYNSGLRCLHHLRLRPPGGRGR